VHANKRKVKPDFAVLQAQGKVIFINFQFTAIPGCIKPSTRVDVNFISSNFLLSNFSSIFVLSTNIALHEEKNSPGDRRSFRGGRYFI